MQSHDWLLGKRIDARMPVGPSAIVPCTVCGNQPQVGRGVVCLLGHEKTFIMNEPERPRALLRHYRQERLNSFIILCNQSIPSTHSLVTAETLFIDLVFSPLVLLHCTFYLFICFLYPPSFLNVCYLEKLTDTKYSTMHLNEYFHCLFC